MLKRSSIIKFILLAIIAILGILLCVCPFSVPYSSSVFNGMIPAIEKGVDLNGGISAVYQCSLPNGGTEGLTDTVDKSLAKIEKILEREQFTELEIRRQGLNEIYILTSGKYANEFNEAYTYIAEGKELSFTVTSATDEDETPEIHANSSVVSSAYVDYDSENASYGVRIEFTTQGIEKLKELKSYAKSLGNDSVYLYLGEISAENKLADVKVSDLGKESIFVALPTSGNYTASSTAGGVEREVAYSIVGGSLGIDLEVVEISNISAVLGKDTNLYLSIAFALTAVITAVCLIIRYRQLGLLAILALSFYAVLFSFFMMALPFITLNLAGVIGSLIAFLISVFAIVTLFEKMKEEYALGKKIHLSCKGGFKKSLWAVLDSHILIILVSIFIWIFAPSILKIFGISMILGALLSMFTTLVLMRWFVKLYLRINSTKAKKFGFYRDKNVKEIRDEEVQIIEESVTTNIVEGGSHE